MELRNGLSRDGVCVIASLSNLCDWDAAVPNPPRLVVQIIQLKPQKRIHQIGWRIKQQSDALRMFRVNGKIERLLRFDPADTKREWVALGLVPSRSFHHWSHHGAGSLGGAIQVGEHVNARTLHCASLSSTPNRRLRSQCGSDTAPANCGNEPSSLLAPFHKICTPMHTSRNAVSFKITFVPVGPILLASRSA